MLRVFVALILSLCSIAHGRPEWIDNYKTEDDRFLYYIGRAGDAPTEALAFQIATANAYEQAIRENFGIQTQVTSSSCETLTGNKLTVHSQALSDVIQVNDFSRVQHHVELNVYDHVNLWILFKYKKSSVFAEKIRLRNMKKQTSYVQTIPVTVECPKSTSREAATSTPMTTKIATSRNLALGLTLGIGSAPIDESATMSELGVTIDQKLFWIISLQAGVTGRLGGGGSNIETDTSENTFSGADFYLGIPLKLSRVITIVPKMGFAYHKYTNREKTYNNYKIATNYIANSYYLTQKHLGGDLILGSKIADNVGWLLKFGARQYEDTKLFKGSLGISTHVGIKYEF